MTKVDVVCLEQDARDRESLKPRWVEFFETAGLSADVNYVDDFQQVTRRAEAGKCDVFICDLSLSGESANTWGGIRFLARLKAEYPEILTIGTTGGKPSYIQIDAEPITFDMFVPKNALHNKAFSGTPNYVERLSKVWRVLPHINIDLPGTIEGPLEGGAPSRDVISRLVRQLFSTPLPVDPRIAPQSVALQHLSGGRSKSAVFSMRAAHSSQGRRLIPAIVKISPKADYILERDRFEHYVKWSLPYTARVDVLGTAESKEWGAIAYGFAHGGQAFDSLSALLAKKDFDRSKQAIDNLFNSAKDFWGPIASTDANWDLKSRYFERYFESSSAFFNENALAVFSVARSAGIEISEEMKMISFGGHTYRQPEHFLASYDVPIARQSLCHGDLNANNLIVSENGNIALIDFRDSGAGHIFEDIITLEGCIRLFWGGTDTEKVEDAPVQLQKLIDRETALNKDGASGGSSQAWALIEHIRKRAFQLFPKEPEETYLYGLAYYCFRLMRIRPLGGMASLRLLACLLAAADTLEPVAPKTKT